MVWRPLFAIGMVAACNAGTGGAGGGDPDARASVADGATPDGSSTGVYEVERARCFALSNQYRGQAGVAALARATDREACVDEQARQESLIDTPHGKLGLCSEARQNHGDGTGWANLELIGVILQGMFDEGPGGPHYNQMTDPNMKRVACGFYLNPNGNFWINIDFFTP